MRAKTGISERRACVLMGLSRTVLRYEGRGERDCGVGSAIGASMR
jgi:hypothetical protein